MKASKKYKITERSNPTTVEVILKEYAMVKLAPTWLRSETGE